MQRREKKMEIEKSNDNNEFFRDEQQESGCNRKQKRKGGLRTLPFIFSNEFCDRFAVAGFNGNLISYLTQVMNMPLVSASNILTIIGGTSSFTPLLGALIAESFAGQYWTITAASLIYQLVRFLIINYFSFCIHHCTHSKLF
nr:protein NRT1/ PTR FAMILY 3.1-like [Arachis hypogaea]